MATVYGVAKSRTRLKRLSIYAHYQTYPRFQGSRFAMPTILLTGTVNAEAAVCTAAGRVPGQRHLFFLRVL